MKEEKDSIRRRILELRGNMSKGDVCSKSSAICLKLLELSQFEQAKLVMCYMDFRNEVITREFITECIRRGKRIALPRVSFITGGIRRLLAYEVGNIENCVLTGMYGILEPDTETTCAVNAEFIDLVVVPGVVFSLNKYRIGYGAGYYDRFLARLKPECTKVGLAFDIQIEDIVPVEEHDIAMDIIITESRIF